MIKFDLLLKRMWTVLAVLFCTVVSAQAAAITYQLTTHVDGRTITATANLNAGDNLNDKMPQTLWRAYTTYKYYSDAALTQEITEAPASGGTVYVDYEFDPPFIVSEDGQEPVWHYLKHEPGVGQKFYYYSEYHGKLDQKYGNDLPFEQTENLKTGSQTLKTRENAQWAFYGDAYCLNLKFNDVNNIETNDFMVCQITSRTIFGRTTYTYKVKTGEKMMPGWQLYVNDALNGSFSLGLPEDIHINQLLWLYDLGDSGQVKDLSTEDDAGRSSNNHITNTDSQGQGWDECLCYAFMATPASDPPGSLNPWRVTYKIQKADGTWYADIIEQKTADNLTPTWPVAGFTPVEGYEYDYFYTDATFTEKFQGDMPNDCNTTLYIKETAPVVPVIYYVTYKIQKADGTWYDDIIEEKNDNNLTPTWPVTGFSPVEGYEYDYFYTDATFAEKLEGAMPADCNSTLFIKETTPEPINYISEPWKTLVLPITIDNLSEYFGEDFEGVPAVDVLELQKIENGVLTSNAAGDFYRCNLIFNPVRVIKANKPYMFRVNRVDEKIINEMYAAEGQDPCDVTTVDDLDNPGISVSMEGTLEPNGSYMDASDGLHFYFGYDQNANAYNFYRVSANIPKNRCWFYVNDNRNPSGAKLNVTFDFNVITGIDKTVVSSKVADGKIYNINGQQVQNTLQKGIYIVNGKKVIVK